MKNCSSYLGTLILSLFVLGLGQLHSGKLGKGIVFAVLVIMLKLAGSQLAVLGLVPMVVLMGLAFVLNLYLIIDALILNKAFLVEGKPRPKVFSYIIFAAVFFFAEKFLPRRTDMMTVPGVSMAPALMSDVKIIVDLQAYKDTPPVRGDVIVFDYPKDVSLRYIKRLIAIPGDTIEMKDRQLLLNGSPVTTNDLLEVEIPDVVAKVTQNSRLNELKLVYKKEQLGKSSYITLLDKSLDSFAKFSAQTMGVDDYFVMGDNRDISSDSRQWGVVKRSAIRGKLLYQYFP